MPEAHGLQGLGTAMGLWDKKKKKKKNGYSKSEQMLFPKELYNPKEHGSALES